MDKEKEKEGIERADSLVSFHGSTHSKSIASSGLTGLSQSTLESHGSDQATGSKFQWKSQWQHAMFFLAYTNSWMSFSQFNLGDQVFVTDHQTNIIQIMLAYIFFGCPTLFIQIFIGQFTQRGCLVLGEMMPVAHGVGYLILVNTLLNSILNVYYSVYLVYYVFVAMLNQPIPAWMVCSSKYYNVTPNCLGLNEIDQCEPCYSPLASIQGPCYDPKVHNLSSSLFLNYVVVDIDQSDLKKVLTPPSLKFIVHLLMTIAFMSIVIVRTMKDLDGAMRIWNLFCITSLIVMIVVIMFTSLRIQGLLFFFDISWKSFFSIKNWVDGIKITVLYLNLSEGGNILFGSYTPVTVNTGTRSSYLCIVHFLIFVLFKTFVYLLVENFLCTINTDISAFYNYEVETYMMAILPEALGVLAAAPLWGTLYFLISFGMTLQTAIIQIIILEASLSEEIINSSYYIYTRFLILLVTFLACMLMGAPQADIFTSYYMSYMNLLRLAAVFLLFCILMLYGFQRFFDDIYFLLRNPPSFYYRSTWVVSLVLSGVAFFVFAVYGNFTDRIELISFILFAMISTLLAGFLVKFIKYLKAKDLMSLLRQADTWGPSDAEAKTNRRIFNPRYEVRFRRKVDKCTHRCLLSSAILKKTLEKELALVSNVLLEIEDNEENKKIKQNELEHLRLHRAAMSKFLAERAPDELAFIFKRHGK